MSKRIIRAKNITTADDGSEVSRKIVLEQRWVVTEMSLYVGEDEQKLNVPLSIFATVSDAIDCYTNCRTYEYEVEVED